MGADRARAHSSMLNWVGVRANAGTSAADAFDTANACDAKILRPELLFHAKYSQRARSSWAAGHGVGGWPSRAVTSLMNPPR